MPTPAVALLSPTGATPRHTQGEQVSTTFDLQVTDFERAPWLPVLDLARERHFMADLACDYLARGLRADTPGRYEDIAREYAVASSLMRAEDHRIGAAYREAYQAWKAAQA